MDLKVISELVKLVSESKLTALEVEEKDFRIKLEKNNSKQNSEEVKKQNREYVPKESSSVELDNNETVVSDTSEDAGVDKIEKVETKAVEGTQVVKSPMVGTFYISSSPETDPFVTKGRMVKKGDTLCIIEAMKLMNEIESEFECEIIEVLVENGSIVEYGQPLFSVK